MWIVSDFGVGINLRPLLRTFICESVSIILLRLTTKFGSNLVCLIWLCNLLWYLFLFFFFCIFVVCSLLFEGVSQSTEFCRLLGSVM